MEVSWNKFLDAVDLYWLAFVLMIPLI